MKLLVLGGTRFLGRHFVAESLARGHALTLFHRGQSHPELFPECAHILGDRDGGLDALAGRSWDAVLDTSGYLPRVVRQSAMRLAGAAGRYLFVSSISVYASLDRPGLDESAPVATLADPATETLTGETYGALKARCEDEVRAAFGERAVIVRPGLIVGPDDPTERFGYWPLRFYRGGDVLAPAPSDAPVQFVDVRDLAAWMVGLLESNASGTLNATGPASPLDFAAMLDACRAAAGQAADVVWVDEAFLIERGVAPWTGLPLWLPVSDHAHSRVDCRRAIAAGLRFRALLDTARDTLRWELEHPPASRPPRPSLGGAPSLDADRESALLEEWNARVR